jgi:hypothetical protein
MLEKNQLPDSLFLIPYWLFKFSSPTVETVGYAIFRNVWNLKMLEHAYNFPHGWIEGSIKKSRLHDVTEIFIIRVLEILFFHFCIRWWFSTVTKTFWTHWAFYFDDWWKHQHRQTKISNLLNSLNLLNISNLSNLINLSNLTNLLNFSTETISPY